MTNPQDWLVGGGLLAIFVAVMKNNFDMNGKMDAMKKERDDKISRVYGRFDEYKESFEGKHVSKDMCSVLHNQIRADLSEVKADLKTILRNNGHKT